ncbi:NAD-binding-8 domain containing protein, partial [Pyrenophora tritici-repentis]
MDNEKALHESSTIGQKSPALDSKSAKTCSTGSNDGDEYGILSGFSTGKLNRCGTTSLPHVPAHRQKKVIIVGAGIAGIQQATVLLRTSVIKHDEMMIFDIQDGYGGVWNKNKYPGCACDVPAIIYSTSYFMNK